jgi:hypothetical protein
MNVAVVTSHPILAQVPLWLMILHFVRRGCFLNPHISFSD